MSIKVFRLNDYEWWAGEDLDSIRSAYQRETGIDPDDPDEGFESPHVLLSEQMDSHIMREFDEDFEPGHKPDGYPTFQQYLDLLLRQGRKFRGNGILRKRSPMKLFQVQDSDRPMWVVAVDWSDALRRWRELIYRENGDIDVENEDEVEPQGIMLVCDGDELLLPQ